MDHLQLFSYSYYLVSNSLSVTMCVYSYFDYTVIVFVQMLCNQIPVLLGLCLLKLSLQFHFNGKIKNVVGMIFSLSIVSFGVFIFANDLIYNIMEQAGVF